MFISLHLLHRVYQFRECRNNKQTSILWKENP